MGKTFRRQTPGAGAADTRTPAAVTGSRSAGQAKNPYKDPKRGTRNVLLSGGVQGGSASAPRSQQNPVLVTKDVANTKRVWVK